MTDEFEKLYQAENQTQAIISMLSGVAIVIACLGLFALASFSAEHRMKEISIRKILGANTLQITKLLSKDFVALVVVSFVLLIPSSLFCSF